MMKKILVMLLFSLNYSQIVNLNVFKLKDYENITINKPSGLVCYELHKDFTTDDEFYLHITCDEAGKKMSKTIFYNLTDVSCKNLNNLQINIEDLKSEFTYSIKEPKAFNEGEKGFFYEYNITKKEDKQKFMLMLFTDFTGEKFSISYAPISAGGILTALLVIVLFIIIISILVCICICVCIRNRIHKSTAPQYPTQSSKNGYTQMMPMVSEENDN